MSLHKKLSANLKAKHDKLEEESKKAEEVEEVEEEVKKKNKGRVKGNN